MSAFLKAGAKDAGVQAAEDAAKIAAKDAAAEAAEGAAKDAAKTAAKQAAENAAKTSAQAAARNAVSTAGKETASTLASKSAKYVAAGVVAAGAAAYIATQYNKKNGSKYDITAIKSTTGGVIITYSPGEKFNKAGDTLTISSTDCTPSLDGTVGIVSTPSLTTVVVNGSITTEGTKGQLVLNTTFESQMDESLASAGSTVGGAAGAAAGGVAGGVGSGLASGLGLDQIAQWCAANGGYIAVGCILFILLACFIMKLLH